jgi:hypothetical protein
MCFKKDLTGNSDRVRYYLKYYEKCEGKPLNIPGFYIYTISWSKENGTPVPDYFTCENLSRIIQAKGKEIPEFVVEWLSRWLDTVPERLTKFTPENEINCITRDCKIAAGQAKQAKDQLLEIWSQIPDHNKIAAVRAIHAACIYFNTDHKAKAVDVLKTIQGNDDSRKVITFPLQAIMTTKTKGA